MLSEEEKKAIERVEDTFYENKGKGINNFQKITLYEDGILDILKLLNIIEKLQKENKEKDKQIDLMAEYIANRDNDEDICKYQVAEWCEDEEDGVLIEVCRKCIKQYFERKCEE